MVCAVLIGALMCLSETTPQANGSRNVNPVVIGSYKQLFIDDKVIDSARDVRLVVNSPYQDHKPVLVADKPWESDLHHKAAIIVENGTWRMWYGANYSPFAEPGRLYKWYPRPGSKADTTEFRKKSAKTIHMLCYAESTDGIHWDKPELGLVEFQGSKKNNIVMPVNLKDGYGMDGGWVLRDPRMPAEKRYHLWGRKFYPQRANGERIDPQTGEQKKARLWHYYSADGFHFQAYPGNPNPTGSCDSHNIFFWDGRINKYVGYVRLWAKPGRQIGDDYRSVRRLISDDTHTWKDTGEVFKVDSIDLEVKVDRKRTTAIVDVYTNGCFKYGDSPDVYLMLPTFYWHWGDGLVADDKGNIRQDRMHKGGYPDTTDVQLATSRDGINWKRPEDRKPFLRLGPQGSLDSAALYCLPNAIRHNDRLRIYYYGSKANHGEGGARLSAFFQAELRVDGFISADAAYSGGELVTKPLIFEGKRLELNLDTSAGGVVRVEAQKADGTPIKGHTLAEADELNGNSLKMPVTWQGKSDVAGLAGKAIRLRFVMRDCKLYAFQFVD